MITATRVNPQSDNLFINANIWNKTTLVKPLKVFHINLQNFDNTMKNFLSNGGCCTNCPKRLFTEIRHKQRTVQVLMMLSFNNYNLSYLNMITYYDSIILMNSNAKFFRLF